MARRKAGFSPRPRRARLEVGNQEHNRATMQNLARNLERP